jgi:TPR repeat protein
MSVTGARRVTAIVAGLALLIAVVVWHSHRSQTIRRASIEATRASTTAADSRAPSGASENPAAIPPETGRPVAPTVELIERDPAAAAKLWHSRAWNVLYAKNRKEFGDDVARLMQLPYDEAWDGLLAMAKDGNIGAGVAVMQIASVCNAEATRFTRPNAKVLPASYYYKELPAAWKPFVDHVGELHDEDHQRITRCEGVGNVLDLATLFFDRFFTADNPEAQVEIAGANEDHQQAIADLREIVAAHDIPRGRAVLGDLLMRSDDAAERAEGRAMLEALAPDNPSVATSLAYCLEHGCGGAKPDPERAREWLEKAGGAGDELALSFLIKSLEGNGDRAAAWAWSRYALDLALDGCFEMWQPTYMQIAGRASDEAKTKAVLTPAEQNAGLAIGYAISGRWEKQARERLLCD